MVRSCKCNKLLVHMVKPFTLFNYRQSPHKTAIWQNLPSEVFGYCVNVQSAHLHAKFVIMSSLYATAGLDGYTVNNTLYSEKTTKHLNYYWDTNISQPVAIIHIFPKTVYLFYISNTPQMYFKQEIDRTSHHYGILEKQEDINDKMTINDRKRKGSRSLLLPYNIFVALKY